MLTRAGSFRGGMVADARPEEAGAERVSGMYLNSVPFPYREGAATWGELAREVFAREVELWPHRRYPMPAMRVSGGESHLIDVLFHYLDFHQVDVELIDIMASRDDSPNEFPLVVGTPVRGHLSIASRTRTLAKAGAERLAALYKAVLADMARTGADGDARTGFPTHQEHYRLTAPALPHPETPVDVLMRLRGAGRADPVGHRPDRRGHPGRGHLVRRARRAGQPDRPAPARARRRSRDPGRRPAGPGAGAGRRPARRVEGRRGAAARRPPHPRRPAVRARLRPGPHAGRVRRPVRRVGRRTGAAGRGRLPRGRRLRAGPGPGPRPARLRTAHLRLHRHPQGRRDQPPRARPLPRLGRTGLRGDRLRRRPLVHLGRLRPGPARPVRPADDRAAGAPAAAGLAAGGVRAAAGGRGPVLLHRAHPRSPPAPGGAAGRLRARRPRRDRRLRR